MPALCVHCQARPPAQAGGGPCTPCVGRLAAELAEVGDLWQELDPVPGGPEGGRRSPGWGSRSPARDDVIVLTDYRSDVSIERALSQICRFLALRANLRPPKGVPGMITLLSQNWALESLSAAHGRAIGEMLARLRTATSRNDRSVPIGNCPTEVPDPDGGEPIRCAAPLRAPLHGDRIICGECGAQWGRGNWVQLGATMRVLAA